MSMLRMFKMGAFVIVFFALVFCSENSSETTIPGREVVEIPLSGVVGQDNAEISGLAWYKDWLVFLIQKPENVSDNQLYKLSRSDIENYLNGKINGPLSPQGVQIIGTMSDKVKGYEGFEAIAFKGDTAYLNIESSPNGKMVGVLLRGSVDSNLTTLTLETGNTAIIPVPDSLDNMAAEALLSKGNDLYAFYEANGEIANVTPVAYHFDTDLNYLGTVPMPHIEYRLTDASALLADNTFWVTNYYYPMEAAKLRPADDMFQPTTTPNDGFPVERLLHLRLENDRVAIADSNSVNLSITVARGRNWEGLVILPGKGFLLATDEHPHTIFGFVAYPGVQ